MVKNNKTIWWKVGGSWFLLIGIVNVGIILYAVDLFNGRQIDVSSLFIWVLALFELILMFLISYLYFQRNRAALTLTFLYAITEGGLKIVSGEKIWQCLFLILISLFIAYKVKKS